MGRRRPRRRGAEGASEGAPRAPGDGAPKAPGDEAKHHIMRLGAHILHTPPLKPNLHPLLAFGGVPTCGWHVKWQSS